MVDNDGGRTDKTEQVTVQAANVDPVASFTAAADHLDVDVDAGTSSDPDGGTIVSYEWDFGDGHTETTTGPTTDHTYTAAGHFTITLKVTDNRGGTHSTTQDVDTTVPPNQHPNAVFDTSVAKLKVTFTNGSNDPDGTIKGYLWDFGDGTPAPRPPPSRPTRRRAPTP